ncbi:MAG: hypothetical protein M2R45_04377 [Verrucomicrobia subdivision 3 bacterium]|nr:hypothetical protein [Limisphaerales bacterium]MCS1416082.1 hypothetical protein [Limisphaerales bacterium]
MTARELAITRAVLEDSQKIGQLAVSLNVIATELDLPLGKPRAAAKSLEIEERVRTSTAISHSLQASQSRSLPWRVTSSRRSICFLGPRRSWIDSNDD